MSVSSPFCKSYLHVGGHDGSLLQRNAFMLHSEQAAGPLAQVYEDAPAEDTTEGQDDETKQIGAVSRNCSTKW